MLSGMHMRKPKPPERWFRVLETAIWQTKCGSIQTVLVLNQHEHLELSDNYLVNNENPYLYKYRGIQRLKYGNAIDYQLDVG